MSTRDTLQELAAKIMAHLEDAHSAAMNIQARDISHEEILEGFEDVERELWKVELIVAHARDFCDLDYSYG